MKCAVRWCRSELAATVPVLENIGDASYRVVICQSCADALGAQEGDDLMAEPIFSRTLEAEAAAGEKS